jgi:hypothetical protein
MRCLSVIPLGTWPRLNIRLNTFVHVRLRTRLARGVFGRSSCSSVHCTTMHCMESQLTIRLPADLSGALARACRQSGRKASDIVRAALRDYLNAPSASGPSPAERVRGLIGSLDSDVPDLAEQHRKYIIESLTRGK